MAAGSTVPTGHIGSNDATTGGPGAGVSQIIPGTGVTVSPPSGLGAVTVNAGVDAVARASATAAAATAAAAAAAAAAAGTAAAAAQNTANNAVTDAANAQSTADGAATDATAALAAATGAAAAASAAQTTATNAATAAAAAQSGADAANALTPLIRYYTDDLPNADATIDIAGGIVKWESGLGITPGAPWTYTLGTAGALNRSELVMIRSSGSMFTITVVNGGPGGGVLLSWVNSLTWQKAVFLFDAATGDWFLDRQSLLYP